MEEEEENASSTWTWAVGMAAMGRQTQYVRRERKLSDDLVLQSSTTTNMEGAVLYCYLHTWLD